MILQCIHFLQSIHDRVTKITPYQALTDDIRDDFCDKPLTKAMIKLLEYRM